MSTYTDTVRISLATPDDIRDLTERNLHLWIGASSPLWAPFWTAASFGVGLWSLGQAMARTMGDTIYDRDVSLALKWPGFEALPKPVESPVDEGKPAADIVEKTAGSTAEAVRTAATVAAETSETMTEAAEAVIEPVVTEPLETAQTAAVEAVETVTETAGAATSATAKASAALAKKAAAATLDLLGQPSAPVADTRPLIDPVTETPVIPALAEATAEPKLPMPKSAPRRPRKS
jgi:hypothetical protein